MAPSCPSRGRGCHNDDDEQDDHDDYDGGGDDDKEARFYLAQKGQGTGYNDNSHILTRWEYDIMMKGGEKS